jgi:membrane associated rhomboid family serine protease
MKVNKQLQFSKSDVYIPIVAICAIWFVYWIEINYALNFTKFGIYPRSLSGLKGVFLAPFIHGDTNHLFHNSVPLFVLTMSLVYFYKGVCFRVLLYGGLLTGLLTWGIAREAYHIGASGIVYLLVSFIFFSGVVKKQYQLVAVSLVVIFLYGSMIWYVFPLKEKISWEGHLSGFLIGLFFAIVYRNRGIKKEKIQFTETAFDLLFDADGNFNPPKEAATEQQESTESIS